nr:MULTISPECIES: DUF6402 family protein [Variovorax]
MVDKRPVHSQTSREDLVYYPVRNRAFKVWQMKHQQGGDFIACSDIRWVTLDTAIRVQL